MNEGLSAATMLAVAVSPALSRTTQPGLPRAGADVLAVPRVGAGHGPLVHVLLEAGGVDAVGQRLEDGEVVVGDGEALGLGVDVGVEVGGAGPVAAEGAVRGHLHVGEDVDLVVVGGVGGRGGGGRGRPDHEGEGDQGLQPGGRGGEEHGGASCWPPTAVSSAAVTIRVLRADDRRIGRADDVGAVRSSPRVPRCGRPLHPDPGRGRRRVRAVLRRGLRLVDPDRVPRRDVVR